jgi:hypothetical protein
LSQLAGLPVERERSIDLPVHFMQFEQKVVKQ